jgi:hypothetical protein
VRKLRENCSESISIDLFCWGLGLDMIEAGGTFGPDGSYGAALIKTGEEL